MKISQLSLSTIKRLLFIQSIKTSEIFSLFAFFALRLAVAIPMSVSYSCLSQRNKYIAKCLFAKETDFG